MSSYPLLTGPIGRSLWRLAAPTAAAMVTQILVAIAETYFFGRLGTEALAGFALVYPLMMLMQMMASGGMGGGGTGLDDIFVAIAAGIVLYAATLALPLLVKPWGPNVLGLHP